ncbi:MAG: RES family NAD+ phosphorylase [Bacteroidia bacterium]
MEVFRISASIHAHSLTASGRANRWNLDGQKVIYTGGSRSLSTLELLVSGGAISPSVKYLVMVISLADEEDLIQTILIRDLPGNWRFQEAYSELQAFGNKWYKKAENLILKVPSAVIPKEYNYVINLTHPAFLKKVKLVRKEAYFWDDRLVKK